MGDARRRFDLSRFAVAACAAAGLLLAVSPSRAPAAGRRLDLRHRERLVQSLSAAPAGEPGAAGLREARTLRLDFRVDLPGIDPDALDPAADFGIRLGEFSLEETLGTARDWRPGRHAARWILQDESGISRGTVKARWSSFSLRVTGRISGRAPYAETRSGDPAGAVEAPLDAAMRFVDEDFRFGGTVRGEIRRHEVRVADGPVTVARVSLEGEGDSLGAAEDGEAPVVAIASPPRGATIPPEGFLVSGSLRDDRSLVRVTCALDGGFPVDVPFTLDPATGFLRALEGTFSSTGEIAGGPHTLVVRAYDAAGNAGSAEVEFVVSPPPASGD